MTRRTSQHTTQRATQSGFVLVLTLWVTALVAIAAAYFSERVTQAVELAQSSRTNVQAALDMASTRAEILYRLSTTSLTEYGLGRGSSTVYLDNRAYRGDGDTLVRLQDTRGLINLNLVDDGQLNRLLGLLGVEAEKRSRLLDTLRDYTDSDSLTRIQGAEASDYNAAGLPPPANTDMTSPWQARRIIGWRDTPVLWEKDRLPNLTCTTRSIGINPNTAPLEVLATLPGVTEDIARGIIVQRQLTPLTHEGQITALTGMPLNLPMGMGVMAIPASTLRITQSGKGQGWAEQYMVQLTPNDVRSPWRTVFYTRVATALAAPTQTEAQTLPPRTDAAPDRLPAFLMGL